MTVQQKKPVHHPEILRTVAALRDFVKKARQENSPIALVPTMGALHEGHISLVREGLSRADIVIVSIFVNPTQFGPHEDLAAYPRTWDADLEKLTNAGAHAVFYPAVAEIYPEGFASTVKVSGVSEPLEGEHRPGHFEGVATIVTKLLLQALPDIALFGEKDYQQLQVIKRAVLDLDIPVEIIGSLTVRDENGLALSSRNAYLSPEEYKIAVTLNKTLFTVAERIKKGERDFAALEAWGRNILLQNGFNSVDYLAIRDAANLQPPGDNPSSLRILATARLGRTRLIDNIAAPL
jgi:pantoate--beta-alanine ligase